MSENIFSNTLLKIKNITKNIDWKLITEDKERLEISKKGLIKSVIESAIWTIVVVVLFYGLPFTRDKFLTLNLHPLAVIVAIVTLKYGTYDGIASSIVAIIGYISVFLISGNKITTFITKFEYYKFFFIFVLTAIILGKYQEYNRAKESRLALENQKLQDELVGVKVENDQVMDINNSLKVQVQQSKGGIIAFQNMRKILETKFTVKEIYEEAMIMLDEFLNCEVSGIYQVEKGKVQLKSYGLGIGMGGSSVAMQREKSTLIRAVKIGNSLMEDTIKLDKEEAPRFLEVMTRRVPLEYPADLEGKQPIFIAPLVVRDEVIAFIEVERLTYNAAKTQNFEIFRVIAEEINNRLEVIF